MPLSVVSPPSPRRTSPCARRRPLVELSDNHVDHYPPPSLPPGRRFVRPPRSYTAERLQSAQLAGQYKPGLPSMRHGWPTGPIAIQFAWLIQPGFTPDAAADTLYEPPEDPSDAGAAPRKAPVFVPGDTSAMAWQPDYARDEKTAAKRRLNPRAGVAAAQE